MFKITFALGLALLALSGCDKSSSEPKSGAPTTINKSKVGVAKKSSEPNNKTESLEPKVHNEPVKTLSAADLLAQNVNLNAASRVLPESKRVTTPVRGYWKNDKFTLTEHDGMPALRVTYASKESKGLDETQESGFGVVKDDQSTTLFVIDAGKNAAGLEKHFRDEMRKRGFSHAPLSFSSWVRTGKKEANGLEEFREIKETLNSWELNKGAVYVAREGDLVLYAIENDSGSVSSTSFGAQRIFLFKDAWKKR